MEFKVKNWKDFNAYIGVVVSGAFNIKPPTESKYKKIDNGFIVVFDDEFNNDFHNLTEVEKGSFMKMISSFLI